MTIGRIDVVYDTPSTREPRITATWNPAIGKTAFGSTADFVPTNADDWVEVYVTVGDFPTERADNLLRDDARALDAAFPELGLGRALKIVPVKLDGSYTVGAAPYAIVKLMRYNPLFAIVDGFANSTAFEEQGNPEKSTLERAVAIAGGVLGLASLGTSGAAMQAGKAGAAQALAFSVGSGFTAAGVSILGGLEVIPKEVATTIEMLVNLGAVQGKVFETVCKPAQLGATIATRLERVLEVAGKGGDIATLVVGLNTLRAQLDERVATAVEAALEQEGLAKALSSKELAILEHTLSRSLTDEVQALVELQQRRVSFQAKMESERQSVTSGGK